MAGQDVVSIIWLCLAMSTDCMWLRISLCIIDLFCDNVMLYFVNNIVGCHFAPLVTNLDI